MQIKLDGVKELQRRLEIMRQKIHVDGKLHVEAGILEDGTPAGAQVPLEHSTAEIATYAAYNEYGTANIPPRPFMHTAIEHRGKQWGKYVEGMILHEGANLKQALEGAGQLMGSDIVSSIDQAFVSWTPNAPRTIQAKTKPATENGQITGKHVEHPLIDTGDLMASIKYRVTEGENGKT